MNREKVYLDLSTFVLQIPPDNKVKKRVQMVIHVLYLSYTLTVTAKLLGTTQKTVSKWVKRYQETGKFGLLDAPRSGRPNSISPELRDFVEKIARSDTAQYSTVFTNWSLQNIHRYLKEVFKEDVSKSSIYRILKSSGFHFRMITETLVTKDPEYALKKQRLRSAEAEAMADASVELLYLDEKGPVHALFYRFKKWSQRPLEIAKNLNRSNGKVILNAAFNKNLNKFWWHFSEKRNSEAFLLLLHQLSLDETLQNLRKVYLVVDNLATHFTQSVQDFLALHPQFELLRLPTYSPELNLIERVFGDLDKQALCNYFFQSAQELMARISNWFLDRMKRPAPELKAVPKKKLQSKKRKVCLENR